MVKDSIKPYVSSFTAAREAVGNPDDKLDNLTWDNVGLQTLKRNEQELSLIKPDNITLTDWNKALGYHIVRKLETERKEAEAKMAEAEKKATIEILKILLPDGNKATLEEKVNVFKMLHKAKLEDDKSKRDSRQQQFDHDIKMKKMEGDHDIKMKKMKMEMELILSQRKVNDDKTKIALSLHA